LRAIVARLDGYSDGVRHLMGDDDGKKIAGIVALVAEVLKVNPTHERAIEAVLGERLQYVLVDSEATATAAINELNLVEGGRGGFIPQKVASVHTQALGPAPQGPGILGLAAQAVSCGAESQNLVDYLLGHVCLVDTLQTAQAARSRFPGYTFVTVTGEVVDGAGVAQGGSDTGAGLLATRREVRDLTEAVQLLTERYEDAVAAQEERTARLEAQEAELAALRQQLHEGQLKSITLHKDLEAAQQEGARHTERLRALANEVAQRQQALELKSQQEDAARLAAEAAEAQQHDVAERVSEMQERRSAAVSQLAHLQDSLTAIRVRMASAQERVAASAAAQGRIKQTILDLEARMGRASDTSQSTVAQIQALQERVAQGELSLQDLVLKARASQEALLNARAHYESEQARLLEAEQALKAARRDETGLADALVQGRMELQRLELERQTLLEGVLERHDILLGDIVGDYHDRPVPTAAAIAEQAELERSIKAMGPINLTAIEECAEVEARYSFLSGQRDDLQAALEALRLAITRINRASKERFKEAFEAVNSMFQKIYPRLFRGGEARLELVGSEDLLEAGVDIIAMPPGKKLQSVGLLSGGEKALTATALVFAIFLIKPSPFCVLDEVDAPLDEANVGRFNEMLREISQVSQFIVITHNKQTMLQMDRLYGITMEEPGMSKVVTVDLDDRQKDQAA
jgi:chromosome segregation protein